MGWQRAQKKACETLPLRQVVDPSRKAEIRMRSVTIDTQNLSKFVAFVRDSSAYLCMWCIQGDQEVCPNRRESENNKEYLHDVERSVWAFEL